MTLRATKSTRSSALAARGLGVENESLLKRSLMVEGVSAVADSDSETKGWMGVEKHQFLPLTGNTTTLVLIVQKILCYCSIIVQLLQIDKAITFLQTLIKDVLVITDKKKWWIESLFFVLPFFKVGIVIVYQNRNGNRNPGGGGWDTLKFKS